MAFLKGKSHYSYVRNHEDHMEQKSINIINMSIYMWSILSSQAHTISGKIYILLHQTRTKKSYKTL